MDRFERVPPLVVLEAPDAHLSLYLCLPLSESSSSGIAFLGLATLPGLMKRQGLSNLPGCHRLGNPFLSCSLSPN